MYGRVDLGPQLAFDILDAGLGEHPLAVNRLIGEQLAGVRVEQRRHLSLRRRWSPYVAWFLADQREMEAERDVRPAPGAL